MGLFTHARNIEVEFDSAVRLRRVEREVTTPSVPFESTYQIFAIIDAPAKSIGTVTEVAGV